MKQLPSAYATAQHGPVFAYAARDDVHACCVTSRDEYVVVHHDDLMPLPRSTRYGLPGTAVILELEEYAGEIMAPHVLDSGNPKPMRPRTSSVGEAVFAGHLFWCAVYAPGEQVQVGWGKPPRTAAQ